jgi:uncharacterized protein involved in exopolysaccharide biosynthesis
LTKEAAELKDQLKSADKKAELAQKELSTLSDKHDALQAKSEKELAESKQEISSLQKMMDNVNADGKDKEGQLNKVKAELASALKSLEEKAKEILGLHEKHDKELQTVSGDYEKEIDALQGEGS